MIFGYNRELSLEYWLFCRFQLWWPLISKFKSKVFFFWGPEQSWAHRRLCGISYYLSSFKSALTLMDIRIYLLVTCIKLNKSMMNLKEVEKDLSLKRNLICLLLWQAFPFLENFNTFLLSVGKIMENATYFLQQHCIIPALWSLLSSISSTDFTHSRVALLLSILSQILCSS